MEMCEDACFERLRTGLILEVTGHHWSTESFHPGCPGLQSHLMETTEDPECKPGCMDPKIRSCRAAAHFCRYLQEVLWRSPGPGLEDP